MNIPAIRAALERLKERPAYPSMIDCRAEWNDRRTWKERQNG